MTSKTSCKHCAGNIEFDFVDAGKAVPCPHCGRAILLKPGPAPEPIDPAFRQTIYPDHILNPKRSFPWKMVLIISAPVFSIIFALAFPAAAANWAIGIFLAVGFLFFYFIPTFAAHGKRDFAAIFVLNLFLGWTIYGWVAALVWAVKKDSQKA